MAATNCSWADRAEMMDIVARHREGRGDHEGAERARQTAEQLRDPLPPRPVWW